MPQPPNIPLRAGSSGPLVDLIALLAASGAGMLRGFDAQDATLDNLATGGAETVLATVSLSVPSAEVDGSLLFALAPTALSCDRQLLPNTVVRVNGTDRTIGNGAAGQQALLFAATSDPAWLHWTTMGVVRPGSGGLVAGTNTIELVTECAFSTMFRCAGGALVVVRFLLAPP